jgi:hypothetical protein
MSKIRRICLFSGPGSGKSTTSARLFSELKVRGYDVEYILEYIKTWAHEGRKPVSYDQFYVFAKQLKSEDTVLRSVQTIVTDCPVMLNVAFSCFYNTPGCQEMVGIAQQFDRDFPPLNFFIERTVGYVQKGRYESQEQAIAFDVFLKDFLDEKLQSPLNKIKVDDIEKIINLVEEKIN